MNINLSLLKKRTNAKKLTQEEIRRPKTPSSINTGKAIFLETTHRIPYQRCLNYIFKMIDYMKLSIEGRRDVDHMRSTMSIVEVDFKLQDNQTYKTKVHIPEFQQFPVLTESYHRSIPSLSNQLVLNVCQSSRSSLLRVPSWALCRLSVNESLDFE